METEHKKAIQREILVGFWKVHILHHAASGPVVGQWMLSELRRHGYEVSPGTLYPMLHRLEKLGWLRSEVDPGKGNKARRSFYLTEKGARVLTIVRECLGALRLEAGP
jgi:DNA-binding PadR family transcriptional regulator